jgi:hypothetical protein
MNSSTIHPPVSRLGHTLGRTWVLALGLMAKLSRSDISNGNGTPPAMSNLKAPTYKNTPRTVVNGPTSRRSGQIGRAHV